MKINSLFILCFVALFACSNKDKNLKPANFSELETVDFIFANESLVSDEIEATGYVKKPDTYHVSSQLNGIIQKLYVSKGKEVEKDQLLISLIDVQFSDKLEQLGLQESALQTAIDELQSALLVAIENKTEASELLSDSLLSRDKFTQISLDVEKLEGELNRTKIQLQQNEREISLTNNQKNFLTIKSPVKGIVLEVFKKAGESALAGQTLLSIKPDSKEKIFVIQLSDRHISLAKTGQSASIQFDALKDKNYPAKLSYVSSQNIDNSPFYEVQLSLDTTDENILPGFFGKAIIQTNSTHTWQSIPPRALHNASGNQGELLLFKNGKAVSRSVTISNISDKLVFIEDQLTEEDTILINTNGIIQPGDSIQIRP